MAKFTFQDIMPPERRKSPAKRVNQSPAAKATSEIHTGERVVRLQKKNASPAQPIRETVDQTHSTEARYEANITEKSDQEYQTEAGPFDRIDEQYERPERTFIDTTDDEEDRLQEQFGKQRNSERSALIVKSGFAIVAIIALFFVVATVFGGATVTITPKYESIKLENKSMKAMKLPSETNLSYSVMQIDITENTEVPASGQKTVTSKATGKIVVYNNYNDKPQRLIKNTRFQSPTGKIYRINESISVPGLKKDGTKTIPGSIEVTVFADEPGPDYNTDPVDFTIPGLKGDVRYEKVYARSKGPIAGGASGIMKSVSDQDLSRADDELAVTLETKLRAKVRANVTDKQIVFPQGILIEFSKSQLSKDDVANGATARVERKASVAAVVFDRKELARFIAKEVIPQYSGEDVSVPDIEQIGFSMEKRTVKELVDNDSLNFLLNGGADIRYAVDVRDIQKSLVNIDKKAFNGVMAAMPMIEKAQASLRPRWESTFPSDPNEIKIVIEEPKN